MTATATTEVFMQVSSHVTDHRGQNTHSQPIEMTTRTCISIFVRKGKNHSVIRMTFMATH